MRFTPPLDTYAPGTGLPWPDQSAREYLAKQLVAAADPSDLEAALRVLNAVANTSLKPLIDNITSDGSGNPITDTPSRRHAQSTWSSANEEVQRAHGWADLLTQAIEFSSESSE